MKTKNWLISLLLGMSALVSLAPASYAAPQAAVGVRLVYSAYNVSTTVWQPLITSSVKAIKGISVMNLGNSVMEVGVANAGDSANTETLQVVVPAHGYPSGYPQEALFLPLAVSQGQRISIKAYDSAATLGEFQLNAFYY